MPYEFSGAEPPGGTVVVITSRVECGEPSRTLHFPHRYGSSFGSIAKLYRGISCQFSQDEVRVFCAAVADMGPVKASDYAELLHAEINRGTLHSQTLRCPSRACDDPSCLLQCREEVLTLRVFHGLAPVKIGSG